MENYLIKQKPKFTLKTKANKIFSLKSQHKMNKKQYIQISQLKQISQFIIYHSRLKYHRCCISICIHLKFNNKLIHFFSLFKDLACTEMYKDHDVISYLHHTVVITAEPTSPPSHNSLANFTVNKSRTVQNSQEQQVWIH